MSKKQTAKQKICYSFNDLMIFRSDMSLIQKKQTFLTNHTEICWFQKDQNGPTKDQTPTKKGRNRDKKANRSVDTSQTVSLRSSGRRISSTPFSSSSWLWLLHQTRILAAFRSIVPFGATGTRKMPAPDVQDLLCLPRSSQNRQHGDQRLFGCRDSADRLLPRPPGQVGGWRWPLPIAGTKSGVQMPGKKLQK